MSDEWAELSGIEFAHQIRRCSRDEWQALVAFLRQHRLTPQVYLQMFYTALAEQRVPVEATFAPPEAEA
jgi:hypothetical protein